MRNRGLKRIPKYAILILYAAFSLLPFIWMLSASLKSVEDVLKIPILWIPSSFHWDNYRKAMFEPRFGEIRMWDYMLNSIKVALVTAGLTIVLSIFVGYGFAKFRFRGRDLLMWAMLSTTLLPFSAVLIPMILITRDLGLFNSFWALILPFALTGQSIFLARQFMITIPDEYMDAARVDGANETPDFREDCLASAASCHWHTRRDGLHHFMDAVSMALGLAILTGEFYLTGGVILNGTGIAL